MHKAAQRDTGRGRSGPTGGDGAPWTTRRLLDWMTAAFTKADIDSPRLCAELLLSHTLGCERMRLYMEADRPATPLEREALRPLVSRALDHEPVQYLVGEAWFYSLQFEVDRRVLVPRPSSETVVETVLRHARAAPGFERAVIADICTGSGCIAVALLKNLPEARAAGIDLSADALQVAKANAVRHGVVDRLDLLEGDLLAPLENHPEGRDLHYLVANPPYIPDHEWAEVPPNVREHEPESALRGGADGLDLVRPLLADGPKRLREGGVLAVEVAASTGEEARALAEANPLLTGVRVEQDSDGLPRVVVGVRE